MVTSERVHIPETPELMQCQRSAERAAEAKYTDFNPLMVRALLARAMQQNPMALRVDWAAS